MIENRLFDAAWSLPSLLNLALRPFSDGWNLLSTSTVLTRPRAVFFQDLRSSHGLNEEMKRLAKSIVQQVVLKYNSHDVYSISSSY